MAVGIIFPLPIRKYQKKSRGHSSNTSSWANISGRVGLVRYYEVLPDSKGGGSHLATSSRVTDNCDAIR
jgi:hypothetical protein